jgi:mannose-1-phosphate guanylyltransferase
MDYAVIMAGGSGTRLWPMSRAGQPKQLIPFIEGRSLLEHSMRRLRGLFPPSRRFICTGEKFRQAIRRAMPAVADANILGEPEGRDTLAAVGLPAAVLDRRDPQATIAVFTADHLIEPVAMFQRKVRLGLRIARRHPEALVTFGIAPTFPATGYGYVQLGRAMRGAAGAFAVDAYKEKPGLAEAKRYLRGGRFVWNSGMFVWRASTLLHRINRFEPEVHEGLTRIARAWDTPRRSAVLRDVYPRIKKISVDYAVMEPASRDPATPVVCVKMPVKWLDVGSWPAYGQTLAADAQGNRASTRAMLLDTTRTLVAGADKDHLVATIGVDDLIIIHTDRATLVCRRDAADRLKELHERIGRTLGERYL